MYILLAVLAFSVLILSHEFGHFIMAKLNDVKVEEFSLGMGPKLFGVKGKETEYLIKALPIGGYVKMLGEAMTGDEEEVKTDDPRAFANKSAARRLSIVAAGPIMNLILAAVLFVIIGYGRGFYLPQVAQLIPNYPAVDAKLLPGDKIVKIDNKKIITWEELSNEISTKGENSVKLLVTRDNKQLEFTIKPKYDQEKDRYLIGIEPVFVASPTIGQSITYGFHQSKSLIVMIVDSFKSIKPKDVGGPITIIKASGAAAKAGIWTLLFFVAFLSINLAIFNIIPFPALDGGWIFLCVFEIITRRKIDEKKVAVANYIGFTLLMILMVLVLIKDVIFPINF